MDDVVDMNDQLQIVLVYSPAPRRVFEFQLQLAVGTTVGQALTMWRGSEQGRDWVEATAALRCGVWGKAAKPGQVLKAHDRIEFYRPLAVDPKTARRQRFVRQGSKGAGLFAARRAGGIAGY